MTDTLKYSTWQSENGRYRFVACEVENYPDRVKVTILSGKEFADLLMPRAEFERIAGEWHIQQKTEPVVTLAVERLQVLMESPSPQKKKWWDLFRKDFEFVATERFGIAIKSDKDAIRVCKLCMEECLPRFSQLWQDVDKMIREAPQWHWADSKTPAS